MTGGGRPTASIAVCDPWRTLMAMVMVAGIEIQVSTVASGDSLAYDFPLLFVQSATTCPLVDTIQKKNVISDDNK